MYYLVDEYAFGQKLKIFSSSPDQFKRWAKSFKIIYAKLFDFLFNIALILKII